MPRAYLGFGKKGKKGKGGGSEEDTFFLFFSFVVCFVKIERKKSFFSFSSFFHVLFGCIMNKEEKDL